MGKRNTGSAQSEDILPKEETRAEVDSLLEKERLERVRETDSKDEELVKLKEILHRKALELDELNTVIAGYRASLSWKVTAPLRYLHSLVMQVTGKLRGNDRSKTTYPSRKEILLFVKNNSCTKETFSHAKVSLIILNRNGQKYLRACLAGIIGNTGNLEHEIIVVDNASSDGSLRFLKSLSLKNLTIIENNENVSFSKANNQAAEVAKGDYLLFLNNDTEPLYNWLHELLHVMEQDDRIAVVGSKLIYPERNLVSNYEDLVFPDHSVQHMGIRFRKEGYFIRPVNEGRTMNPFDAAVNIQREVPAVTAACMLVRREVFDRVGGFDEQYVYGYEDIDFCLKVGELGYKIVYCPGSTLFHYEFRTQNNELKEKKEEHRIMNMEIFSQKWYKHLRKKILTDKLSNRLFYSPVPLKIGMVITEDSEDTPAGDYYTAKGLGKELERLGFTVEYIPLLPEQEWYNVPDDTDVLIVLLDNYNLKRVGNNDIIKIAWIRNWVEKWVRHEWFSDYDVILTSSEEARSMVKERTGREAEILMIGADADIFTPLESREEYQSDIVFTGNYWGAHRDIIDSLQVEPKWDFHIYGNNWDQIDRLKKYWKGFVNYKELPFIYNSARIVLDDHNHVTKPYGMINSRVFEAMACGSCVVTNAVKDIFTIFSEEAISVYRNSDDLTRIITELLSDDDRRRRIGQKAREVILQRHTYKKRAEQFREILLRTVEHETLS